MVWRIDGPQGNESGKIKWEIVQWTRGRGLDVGCGIQKTYPHFIGVDNGKDGVLFGHPINPDVRVQSAAQLPMFASGSMDFVFSSHLLEHFPLRIDDPKTWANPIARVMASKLMRETHTAVEALREWLRVIKRDGYLVLYVPDEDEYPKVGEEGANPDHCFNCNYEVIYRLLAETGSAFDIVDFQQRNQGDEYSLYFVVQKVSRGANESWKGRPQLKKTCGLVRYGAYGDLLQCSSVLRALHEEGYTTTVYTSPPGDEVIRHDPHVHAFYLQDKDQVPNHLLGEYWKYHAKKFDKWVNLSESVECTLLSIPGRTPHTWSPAARHRYMNHNYVEMQHLIASVPFVPRVRFHPTQAERDWAQKEAVRLLGSSSGPLIIWSLNGSSVHKSWGGLDATIASILLEFPSSRIVLVGGPESAILQVGWEKEPRVFSMAGLYEIRQTLTLVHHADVLIGPETGVMNAAANLPMPKVVFLSHSTHENLTRDWVNTFALASAHTQCPGRGNNEAPACHQMHYDWSFCQQFTDPTSPQQGTAQCQADIDGVGAWEFIRKAIEQRLPAGALRGHTPKLAVVS